MSDMLRDAGRFIDRYGMVWLRRLDAPVERVWETVSTKEGLSHWWIVNQVEIDLRPGGLFKHHWENTVDDFKKNEYIEFGEKSVGLGGMRFELKADGDGTVFSFIDFWEGNATAINQLTWLTRDGNEAGTVGAPGPVEVGAFSPDGDRLLVSILDERSQAPDLWMMDLIRGTSTRFTFDPALDTSPVWSPDGERILFLSGRGTTRFSIYEKHSSGAGTASAFIETSRPEFPNDWSADGEWVVFGTFGGATRFDLHAFSTTTGDTIVVANSEFAEGAGRLSPDGNWITYNSNESGSAEVYVQAFPEAQGKWQISTGGGSDPFWSGDGTELFYMEPGERLMVVEMSTEAGFRAGTPKLLFTSDAGDDYLPTRDGNRFLFAKPLQTVSDSPITVVVNWAAELEAR